MSFYPLFGEYMESPLTRKKRYVQKVANVFVMRDIYFRFLELDWLIKIQIGFSFLFRWLLDLHLQLGMHIPEVDIDTNFYQSVQEVAPEAGVIEKCIFGEGIYGVCLIDPRQVTSIDIERAAWYLTYKTTDHSEWKYKHISKTLKDYVEAFKKSIIEAGVADFYVNSIENLISVAEGKVLTTGYWGFACWDVSPWNKEEKYKGERIVWVPIRYTEDWETELDIETINPYESHWGLSSWHFARWCCLPKEFYEKLQDDLDKAISEFHKRVEPLWQSVFFLQRTDRMHIKGGFHQVRLGHKKYIISRILDRYGVPAHMKKLYYSFAEEVLYLYHESHRKYKNFKQILNIDSVIEKWSALGLDKQILKLLVDTILSGVSG